MKNIMLGLHNLFYEKKNGVYDKEFLWIETSSLVSNPLRSIFSLLEQYKFYFTNVNCNYRNRFIKVSLSENYSNNSEIFKSLYLLNSDKTMMF